MSAPGSRPEDRSIVVEPPANVLCRAPTMSDGSTDVCPTVGPDGARNLLFVSLTGNPDRRLDAWRRHGGLPDEVAILSAETTRGAAAASDAAGTTLGPDGRTISTATVSEPGDLTGLGIKVNQCLSAWEDEAALTVVCFDSVTTLLQYVDTQRAFRFFHVLTRRVRSLGALAHYHVDPAAHDEQTIATIEGLFSDVYEYDEATGAWSTR
jgi:hypothetical protein